MSDTGDQGLKFDLQVSDGTESRSKPYLLGYVGISISSGGSEAFEQWQIAQSFTRWTSPVFLQLVPKSREFPQEFLKKNLKRLSPEQFKIKTTPDGLAYTIRKQ